MSVLDQAPRRLTPTERLHEVTLAAIQKPASPPEHTVSLTLNAKGDVQIEVTGRGHDLAQIVADTTASFDALRLRYPRAGEGVGRTPVTLTVKPRGGNS